MKNHYGVYFNKKLVYIGKTSRNFYQRFSEHKSNMKYQGTSENLNLIFWDGSVWRQLMQQVVMLKRIDLIQDQFIPLFRKRKIG